MSHKRRVRRSRRIRRVVLSRKKRLWIARKIRILMREGRPSRQSIAIAYRMAGVSRKVSR